MKLMILIIPLVLVFSSCGLKLKDHNSVPGGREFDTTNPAFNSYIQKFESQGKSKTGDPNFSIGDIPINFKEIERGDIQGVCNEYTDGTKEILIKKSWWDSVDDGFRESLLFHELGHCRLGRTHHDETIEVAGNQYKASLMSSYIVESAEYIMHQNDYFDELFTQDKSSLVNSLNRRAPSNQ